MTGSIVLSTEDVVERLRLAIIDRELTPGSVLSQGSLAAGFGVSRIPLREALRTLAAEGLVANRFGRQSVVTELSPEEAAELYDIRLAIEPPLAAAVVDHVSRHRLETLASLVDEMDEAIRSEDRVAFSRANYRFHNDLYRIAGTKHSSRFIVQAMNLTEPYSRVYLHLLHGTARAQAEHRGMVEAIEQGDRGRLKTIIQDHLVGAREALLQQWSSGSLMPDRAPQ
jgi:DNA-binding GntR family transcriptional regulator